MPASKDLYDILGVSRSASQDEIRKAYLKLAHKYHPDKTGGDPAAEEKLKEINGAYDVLKNPEKRARYDQFGSADASGFGGFGGGSGGFGGGGAGAGFEGPFEDFFDVLFGQGRGRGRSGPQPGNDLEMQLDVTLEEVAFGGERSVRFSRMESCGDCAGSGAAAGSKPETCSQCGGAGQVRMTHGFFNVARTCPRCQGSGRIIGSPCRKCRGDGRMKATRELKVSVPKGVESGQRIRVEGEGEPGPRGGMRGDLYLLVNVEPHSVFAREGQDIHCEAPVHVSQAALGATIRVPTLKGEAELKVPAGTQSGAQLRLRGLGLPDLRGYRVGDQVVKVVIETPAKLTARQKELLEEFESLSSAKTYPRRHAFEQQLRKR